jgi:hypothetical protein
MSSQIIPFYDPAMNKVRKDSIFTVCVHILNVVQHTYIVIYHTVLVPVFVLYYIIYLHVSKLEISNGKPNWNRENSFFTVKYYEVIIHILYIIAK